MNRKIAVDLDDVSFNFMDPFLYFYNSISGTSFKRKDMFSYRLEDVFEEPTEQVEKKLRQFYDSSFFENLPTLQGARFAFKSIKEKGDEIIIVTSRFEEYRGITNNALRENFSGNYSNIFYSFSRYNPNGKTKAEICEEQGASCMIEDCLKYAFECDSKGIPVFLMNNPWNQGNLEGTVITRVNNWKEILKNIDSKKVENTCAVKN